MMRAGFFFFLLFSSIASAMVVQGRDIVSSKPITIDTAQTTAAIVFMSGHCPCSRSYEPILTQLAERFSGFSWVGVISESAKDVAESRKHFQSAGLPFSVILDVDHRLADHFRAQRTPHAFVVRGDEELYAGAVGSTHTPPPSLSISEFFLARALESVQRAEPIQRPRTPPLGCAIGR